MSKPEKLFRTVSQYKKIMNPNFRKQYFINFNEARQKRQKKMGLIPMMQLAI